MKCFPLCVGAVGAVRAMCGCCVQCVCVYALLYIIVCLCLAQSRYLGP